MTGDEPPSHIEFEECIDPPGHPGDHFDTAAVETLLQHILDSSADDGIDTLVPEQTDPVERFLAPKGKVDLIGDLLPDDGVDRHQGTVPHAGCYVIS
jgi:hypothetical protein